MVETIWMFIGIVLLCWLWYGLGKACGKEIAKQEAFDANPEVAMFVDLLHRSDELMRKCARNEEIIRNGARLSRNGGAYQPREGYINPPKPPTNTPDQNTAGMRD